MEVRGYANAADWVYSQGVDPSEWAGDGLLTLTEVRRVHKLALDLVRDVAPHPNATASETPGSFREHEIQPFPEGMTPPSWVDVPAQVSTWVDEVNALTGLAPRDVPEALASVHVRFEQIHPFLDGNGRTGRLLLNLILVRMGYPPAIIYKGDRVRYLRALRQADQGDYGALGEVIARAVLDNLYKFIVPAIAGPNRLVPLPVLADEKISGDALRVAAARGRLKAQKGPDGMWRSSRVWVDEYLAARAASGRPKRGS